MFIYIKNIIKDKRVLVLLGFIVYGAFIRIQELGYSNLQGDEINPLDYLYEENFIHYILNQKRGPLQYLVNFANTSLFGDTNEFQVRLPYLTFALAGFITLYLLTKKLFDRETALYTLALMSINGLFIAFSRIAQYQSFLFFALPLTGYLFIKHFETNPKLTNLNPNDKVQSSNQIQSSKFKGFDIWVLNLIWHLTFGFWIFCLRILKRVQDDIKSYKYLIASAAIYSLCLLAHYDALSMLPFFGLFALSNLIRNSETSVILSPSTTLDTGRRIPVTLKEILRSAMYSTVPGSAQDNTHLKQTLKDCSLFLLVSFIPNLFFYGAMRFNPYYEKVTRTYLSNRLGFGGFMPRLPDIMPIVSLYIPKHYLLVLLMLLVIGLIGLRGRIVELKIWKIKFRRTFIATMYVFLCSLLAGATIFGLYPIKPRTSSLLVIAASIGIITILLFSKRIKPAAGGLVGWFLFPYCIYFFIIRDPRTHIYTAFIPGFILAGLGIKRLIKEASNRVQPAPGGLNPIGNSLFVLFTALLAFESTMVWQMFVDKTPEYPWWNKTVFGCPIYVAGHSQHQKPEGVFGVPYYRGWERLGEGFEKGCLRGSFYSNEKNSISYFYTRIEQVEKNEADNLVLIEGPHSWKFIEESDCEPEKESYTLIKTIFSKHGLPVMYIWGRSELYPEGEPLCEF